MERIAIAIQDGGAGAGAQHGGAGRGPTSFLSCHRTSMWSPRQGDFLISNFHPGLIPGNLVRNDSCGEEVLAGKWGGLFFGYLLSEKTPAALVRLMQPS